MSKSTVLPDWKQYQEDAAAFFRSLGLDAETDVPVVGVRTTHEVDVVVRSKHAGFDITWLVECKHWKTPVSKLHVLGLREIVADTGADRGVLLAESGFQEGALEAANLTNVKLTSLADLGQTARHDFNAMRLRELYDRIERCHALYWDMSKDERIARGLRYEVGSFGYSGARMIDYCKEVASRALRVAYPIRIETMEVFAYPSLKRSFSSSDEVIPALDRLLTELEGKLAGGVA